MTRVQINQVVRIGLAVLVAGCLEASAQGATREPASGEKLGKVTTLVTLDESSGTKPTRGLTLGDDGNFYGTTPDGGQFGHGTLFRMSPAGALTVLHEFSGPDDGEAGDPPIQANDGALYGVAVYGDPFGTLIYRVRKDGTYEAFRYLPVDRGTTAGLIQGRDGNLYGTFEFRDGNAGGLYRLSLAGKFSMVASFSFDGPMAATNAPLEADDGNFYITAALGGSHDRGGLLQVTPQGVVTTLYEFSVDEGAPCGALVFDASHDYMYGATDGRIVFRYRVGDLEPIAQLPAKGEMGALSLGPDGTHFHAILGSALYSISTDGKTREEAEMPGHSWQCSENMAFNAAGAMFGTTVNGGNENRGTVFKVKRFGR